MGALVDGVRSMVRQMAPLHTSRWSDDRIARAIHIADLEIREEAEVEWASTTIELYAGAYYYTIPADAVSIRSVEFLRDGIVHDCMVAAASLTEMDEVSLTWRDDTGTTPLLFSVVSAPGIVGWSRLMIWPAPSSASGEALRVNYVKCRGSLADISDVEMPDDIMRSVYLPRVLAHLLATDNIAESSAYMQEYMNKLPLVKARYTNRTNRRASETV